MNNGPAKFLAYIEEIIAQKFLSTQSIVLAGSNTKDPVSKNTEAKPPSSEKENTAAINSKVMSPASASINNNATSSKTRENEQKTDSSSIKSSAPLTTKIISQAYIFADSFEEPLSNKWTTQMVAAPYSGSLSNKYAQEGSASYRVELRRSDVIVSKIERSEIAVTKPEQPLQEHTYTFSLLLPQGGDEDYALDPMGSEIIAQWHNCPDPGEEWTSPPLALLTVNGRYVLERCWDDAAITSNDQMSKKGYVDKHDLGSYLEDKGKWVTWTFHVKWGWLTSQNPQLEVYKDGVEVLDLDGFPNTTNDHDGVYMKLGIYKWEWGNPKVDESILSKRIIYLDNVKIS